MVRWDSYAHFEAGWAQMGGDASAATSQPARPWGPEGYLKTEQRFMRAVGQLPRRLDYSPRRAYEVRNYTFGEGWTAENAAQYCQWAADEVVAPGGGVHSAPATCFFAAGETLSTFASNVCFCLTWLVWCGCRPGAPAAQVEQRRAAGRRRGAARCLLGARVGAARGRR